MSWLGKFQVRRKSDGSLGEAEVTLLNLQGGCFVMVRWEGGHIERNMSLSWLFEIAERVETTTGSSSRELLDKVDAVNSMFIKHARRWGRHPAAGGGQQHQKRQQWRRQQQQQGKLAQQRQQLQDEQKPAEMDEHYTAGGPQQHLTSRAQQQEAALEEQEVEAPLEEQEEVEAALAAGPSTSRRPAGAVLTRGIGDGSLNKHLQVNAVHMEDPRAPRPLGGAVPCDEWAALEKKRREERRGEEEKERKQKKGKKEKKEKERKGKKEKRDHGRSGGEAPGRSLTQPLLQRGGHTQHQPAGPTSLQTLQLSPPPPPPNHQPPPSSRAGPTITTDDVGEHGHQRKWQQQRKGFISGEEEAELRAEVATGRFIYSTITAGRKYPASLCCLPHDLKLKDCVSTRWSPHYEHDVIDRIMDEVQDDRGRSWFLIKWKGCELDPGNEYHQGHWEKAHNVPLLRRRARKAWEECKPFW
ncbi:hypothetical protein Vretifemale_9262 [Volvox reticuliferus]|uniref:Chromo domain-containing protein n=1 Tax=Volvox reticuliferus TaxID=1737510 RepID=A0A8J4CCY7_9CHLO|nr:hypothetical protein Vretifemale_9262 [Volvox reticuliferus]